MELDINEIKRYMNYKSEQIDHRTNEILNNCLQLIEKEVNLKSCTEVFNIKVDNDIIIFEGAALEIKSESLSKHLEHCSKAIIFAATLGSQVDSMIKRLEITKLSDAYIFNAVAVDYIEKYCDSVTTLIEEKYNEMGLYITNRFSPGYGDLSLEYQKQIERLLNTNKKIGLTVLDNYLMIPSKSVTAFIGVQNFKDTRSFAKCGLCLESGYCSGKCRENSYENFRTN